LKDLPGNAAQRFKERILHTYFVRCDMSLILAVVVASGLLSSKLLLECGVRSLVLRYPLALLASFLAFLLLIRVWIWYVFCRAPGGGDTNTGGFQIIGGGGGGSSGTVHFGGGDSGGAGASGAWGESAPSGSSSSGGGHGGGGSGFDLDLDDDWAIILLLAALALAVVGASGYLIYAAPHILPEAAWQAGLAGGLARIVKPAEHTNWLPGVLRSSCLPFAAVLILVVALAWAAHQHCPAAVKLAEALYCPAP
jgi:hypothetical protein